MISKILSYLLDAWETVVDFAMMAVYARVVPDWHFILQAFLIAAFFLGSAFLSATIAESRRHKMKFHFLLGLFIPYIYPLVMALRMKTAQEKVDIEEAFDPLSGLSNTMSEKLKDIQQEQHNKHDKRVKRVIPEKETKEVAEDEQAEQVVPEEEILEVEEIVEEEKPVFTQRYFQGVAVDSSGAKAGPFNLVVLNGSQFKVCQIKNIQADMASFEVDVSGKIKNIRIKYDNIKTFEKI
ncbi:MAG: hypothetical protein KAS17_04165 [Victivallaceae bacterium]|nr:hypothetical protein [Victivallaceae bacterium]